MFPLSAAWPLYLQMPLSLQHLIDDHGRELELLPEFPALVDVDKVPLTENGDGEAEGMSDFVTHSK